MNAVEADVLDFDRLGDEFDRLPPWVDDVARAIGATFRDGADEADPLGERRTRLADVQLELDDQDTDNGGRVSEDARGEGAEEDPYAVLDEMSRDVERMEAEDLADVPATVTTPSTWPEFAEIRPGWLVSLVEGLLRNHHLRRDLVEKAEDRMLPGIPGEHRDPALIQAAWEFAGAHSRRRETAAWLRRVRNEIVSVVHRGNAYGHHVPNAHPDNLKAWRPKGGMLVVNEVASGSASFGHPALLEHTPLKMIYYGLRTWQTSQAVAVEDVDVESALAFPKPTFFDATAGSGTVGDYLANVHGCDGISIDRTPMSEHVRQIDLRRLVVRPKSIRDVAWLAPLNQKAKWKPVLAVDAVDLVFFDPPSRGTPTHAELYEGSCPAADLGSFHRDDYIAACVTFIRLGVEILRPGGYVVYLVRHGVRDRQRVIEDNGLVVELKLALGPSVTVERQIPIKYKKRIPQVSLGAERVPATLLMMRRSA